MLSTLPRTKVVAILLTYHILLLSPQFSESPDLLELLFGEPENNSSREKVGKAHGRWVDVLNVTSTHAS